MTALALRLLTTLFAGFTSLIAVSVLMIASLSDAEGGPAWVSTKLVAGGVILVLGAVTAHRLWVSRRTPLHDRLIQAAAAGLMPLGALTVVGTVHLAMLSGDIEWYMVIAGLAMICQGFLTLLSLWKPNAAGA